MQLLADAGFTADNPATVHFWFPTEVTRPYMPDPAGLHQAITQMLEDAGFVVESHSDIWDDPGYLFDAQNGYYDLHFLGWTGDWDDPGNFYGIHFATATESPRCSSTARRTWKTRSTRPMKSRSRKLAEQRGQRSPASCTTTCASSRSSMATPRVALAPNVSGYQVNPTGSESMATVSISE